MKRLWAPWRLEYIRKDRQEGKKSSPSCVFCGAQDKKPSVKNLILHQGQKSYIIMNKYPYVNGHLMVIPYRHLSDFTQLTKAEHAEMGQLISLSIKALKAVYDAQGFNVGMNLGAVAGAGIGDHLHHHIVPRWSGDHNFMPVLGESRVIMQHLSASYRDLRKALGKLV